MELFNELPEEETQAIEDFLTFIPIYESKRRLISLRALLRKHRRSIAGQICMEAGAGRGLFAREMADLGARKVYAVERSAVLFQLLEQECADHKAVVPVEEDIEDFEPDEPVDVLFHELYGPLVLDETMLSLRRLPFRPGMVLPDGGALWAMPLSEQQMMEADPAYGKEWKQALSGALVSDLVSGIAFQPVWKVFQWDVHQDQTAFEFELPAEADYLALCGEITHEGQGVLKMWWTHNWPVIFTPVAGKRFRLEFREEDYYTAVHFDWIG